MEENMNATPQKRGDALADLRQLALARNEQPTVKTKIDVKRSNR
jgi:hypothetical protein